MHMNEAVKAARIGGDFLKGMFTGEKLEVGYKGKHDIVTSADRGAEQLILEFLGETFPEHRIVSEESGELGKKDSEFTWYVDPLDGTTNFYYHIPYFNTSIALQKGDEIVCGAVYNPILNEVFYAGKGKGAFLNGERLSPSANSVMGKAFIGCCHGREDEQVAMFLKLMGEFKYRANDIRKLGSAALELCYVASGRIDGFIGYGVKPWDFKAGLLIGMESGCRAGGIRGEKIDLGVEGGSNIVMCSPKIYDEVNSIIMKII